MVTITQQDIYEIRIASLVSNVDKDVVIELYQPLIGSTAVMLYLTLLKQKRNENDEEFVFTHEYLMGLMQLSPNNLLTARHALEGVGLLRSYEKQEGDSRYFIYVLYAPKTPKAFFDDVLFKGLLVQMLGQKEAKRLASHYQVDLEIEKDFKEVSASFVDIFNPNYDDPSFKKDFGKNIIDHEVGRPKIDFSEELFFKHIESNTNILKSAFTKKDMREIERLATLFNLSEVTMASIVADCYMPHSNPHFDYSMIADKAKEQCRYPFLQRKAKKSEINGESELANKVRMMESMTPEEYLRVLQGGAKAATSDLYITESLATNYGLPNGIINAIIEYTLHKNNNVLSKNYCEKLAASIVRERLETAIDAMNYLNKVNVSSRGRKPKVENPYETVKPVVNKQEDEMSDEEINDIIASIQKHKKGGKK